MLESLTPLPEAVGLGAGTGYVESYGAQHPRDLLQTLLCAYFLNMRPLFCEASQGRSLFLPSVPDPLQT